MITPILYFNNVDEALAPLSAGTEYTVCVLDCNGNPQSVGVPHPKWTNTQGKTVVLLDAIELGGPNGLNS